MTISLLFDSPYYFDYEWLLSKMSEIEKMYLNMNYCWLVMHSIQFFSRFLTIRISLFLTFLQGKNISTVKRDVTIVYHLLRSPVTSDLSYPICSMDWYAFRKLFRKNIENKCSKKCFGCFKKRDVQRKSYNNWSNL